MSISASQIKDARERLRMTQQELADGVGVSLRTVGSWERGESVPRNRLATLMDALELSEGEGAGPEWGRGALLRAVGRLAKQRREEFGLSRVNFAKEVGLSDSIVRDLEIAHHVPMSKSLWKIEKGLGWKRGSIEEVLESGWRAAHVSMEDFDDEAVAFPEPNVGLRNVPTDALLAEVMRRLSVLQAGLGSKPDFDLAASSNREHLEDDAAEG